MLDMETIRLIDIVSIELRKALELPISRSENDEFQQVQFDELSYKIQKHFDYIEIKNNYHSDRSYVVRTNKSSEKDAFLISVGLDMVTEKRIDCLMHEMAHILMHKEDIQFEKPKWKNAEPWEQEDEANCLSRAFLMPKEYFMYALIKYSSNDGSVDIEKMSSYFKVQERLVIERGRDLFVWD